jgi:hypothetical protein
LEDVEFQESILKDLESSKDFGEYRILGKDFEDVVVRERML